MSLISIQRKVTASYIHNPFLFSNFFSWRSIRDQDCCMLSFSHMYTLFMYIFSLAGMLVLSIIRMYKIYNERKKEGPNSRNYKEIFNADIMMSADGSLPSL